MSSSTSPPSVINSPSDPDSSPYSFLLQDFDTERFEDESALSMEDDDIVVIMGKALGHLERVTEHLRQQGLSEDANSIAKDALRMYVTFNDATADWDIEKCLMKIRPVVTVAASANPKGKAVLVNKVVPMGEEVKKMEAESWAAIAATDINGENRLVKFRPCDGLKRSVTIDDLPVNESEARVIWVKPWDPARRSLSSITERIDQGPLLSIAYSETDRALCIIFQHAQHARGFLEANMSYTRRYNYGLFGQNIDVLEGQAYPYDEGLKKMEIPWNERRRLTFARQRLFADGMGEAQFRRDLTAIVGEQNIELIWLFNSGNATVVFTATLIARLVRDEFLKRAKRPGPYQNVMVGFSHDPCERPLNLITQLPPSRNGHQMIHKVFANPASSSSHPLPVHRRATTSAIDKEGWQTVGRKK